MTENILFADYTDRGRDAALQALVALDAAHDAGSLKLREARVIRRDEDGDVEVPGEVDHTYDSAGFAVGGVVGALVGLLGGPVGVLIGFGAGGLIGGAQDARRVIETNTALEELTAGIPPGSTVLVAEAAEDSTTPADQALGSGVRRYEAAKVRADLEEALKAAEAGSERGSGADSERGSGAGSGREDSGGEPSPPTRRE
ncbi:DUF1269 domain-containing protein [Streptomyces iconiensis]|uniref:DUF1269 domain-containing protein n=1 Tax=Streptomyces iconiensis TaxID=1384038 RepID=A0ABT7A715_9ACTN|nr:DUF1269 domain-containing protein [Streptomyces iconiensis]MDJ1136423.1 DUF1269 domain-containing protein [Streptomyces iconiensis]